MSVIKPVKVFKFVNEAYRRSIVSHILTIYSFVSHLVKEFYVNLCSVVFVTFDLISVCVWENLVDNDTSGI